MKAKEIECLGFKKLPYSHDFMGIYRAESKSGFLDLVITDRFVSINFYSSLNDLHLPIINHFAAQSIDDIIFVLQRTSIDYPGISLNINPVYDKRS